MNKKVVFIIGTLSTGGAERVVSNLSINLSKEIESEIILFGKQAKIEYGYRGKITFLDHADPANPFTKFITLIKRLIKLKKIKRINPNSTIISFLEYPNLMNMLTGKYKNSVVSVRNYMSSKHQKGLKASLWNITIKLFYKKAKKVIVVSKEMKKDLIENYQIPKEKIVLIYNSYPIKEIDKLVYEKLTVKEYNIFDKPTIITVGRLNKQKGQHHLLNSFKIIKKSIPEAQLVFLGEGILEKVLRNQARDLKVEKDVHFLGFKQNPFKYIANSKVFVMTSYYEGFPNALAEAMVCKVPVISTDCASGPREILAPDEKGTIIDYNEGTNRYGYLVPAFDNENEEIVEKIISGLVIDLIKDIDKNDYYSHKAYERIHDFNINQIINDWMKIIKHE